MLNFEDYPDITKGDIFWRAPPDSLKRIPFLYDRAASSLHMLFIMGSYTKREGYTPEIHVAACIRAALVEFIGIEESLKNGGVKFQIRNTSSPLLHFMRLLRNYQVHIGQHQVQKRSVEVTFAGDEVSMPVAIIDNLNADQFMDLDAIKKYKNYTHEEVEKMISLFEEQQCRLGVYELLRRGVNRLVSEVENAF